MSEKKAARGGAPKNGAQQRQPAQIEASVVIATYDRGALLRRLLTELAGQSLAPNAYEVIVIDDGSTTPAEDALAGLNVPYRLRLERQANAGAAAARHRGVTLASGRVIVIVDDDMQVPPGFIAAHLAHHQHGARVMVFGHIRPDAALEKMPIFERYHARMLDRFVRQVTAKEIALRGNYLCTGNVSFLREDYLGVGGFDASLKRSEDAELGLRLEQAGVTPIFSLDAYTMHGSDHQDLKVWRERAYRYGVYDLKISRKHAELAHAHPYRFLKLVSPLSRPLLAGALLAPGAGQALARAAMACALYLDRFGAEDVAIAATTLVYGLEYFRGVRGEAPDLAGAARELVRFVVSDRPAWLRATRAWNEMTGAIAADYEAIRVKAKKYQAHKFGENAERIPPLSRALAEKIGLQMLASYRLMRFFRAAGLPLAAKAVARAIRHLYGAEIHWDAEIAPGVVIVHGNGLVLSHAARVGPGCVLFQNVTLGEGIDPRSREVGSPTLEAEVHVGPGAVLTGPITIGAHSKITANARVSQSAPARSLIESPEPAVRSRAERKSAKPEPGVRLPGVAAGN